MYVRGGGGIGTIPASSRHTLVYSFITHATYTVALLISHFSIPKDDISISPKTSKIHDNECVLHKKEEIL